MATTQTTAFNARALARMFSAEKLYRVYFAPGGLFFIRVGGAKHDQLAMHFGLIGFVISSLTMKGRLKKAEAKMVEMDQRSLRDRLEDHKDNFRETFENIITSRIDRGGGGSFALNAAGAHAGRWTLDFEDRKKMILQFDSVDDMRTAIEELPKVLGDTHENNVEWNEKKRKYVKKKKVKK